jgi:hypothetical protein
MSEGSSMSVRLCRKQKALITTEEIPSTVRRLADGAGVYVFAASDLFYLLRPFLKKHTVAGLRALIKKQAKTIQVLN